MVRAKTQLWGLSLHAGVHYAVMLAIVGQARQRVWLHLLVLALIHFTIDVGKNMVYRLKPSWVIAPYLVDQLFHYISIILVSLWIERQIGPFQMPISRNWVILAIGYLIVTFVWSISEKILYHANPEYRLEMSAQFWPRMITRSVLLSGFLLVLGFYSPIALALSTAYRIPYLSGVYRRRALCSDLAAIFVALAFIQLAV
jgi:hypothetical protein